MFDTNGILCMKPMTIIKPLLPQPNFILHWLSHNFVWLWMLNSDKIFTFGLWLTINRVKLSSSISFPESIKHQRPFIPVIVCSNHFLIKFRKFIHTKNQLGKKREIDEMNKEKIINSGNCRFMVFSSHYQVSCTNRQTFLNVSCWFHVHTK